MESIMQLIKTIFIFQVSDYTIFVENKWVEIRSFLVVKKLIFDVKKTAPYASPCTL